MNHSYQIETHEVDVESSGQRRFIAQLTNIHVEIGGEMIKPSYPNKPHEAKTYTGAMLKANKAFKVWLTTLNRCQCHQEV